MKSEYSFKCTDSITHTVHDGILIISYSSTVLIDMSYYKLKYIALYDMCKLLSATSPVLL